MNHEVLCGAIALTLYAVSESLVNFLENLF